jgi:hypothetical protein
MKPTRNALSGGAIDRRHFFECVAGASAMASIGSSVFARGFGQAGGIATSGDSRLPDGTPYAAWEQPLTFSKTYYVANGDTGTDDVHTSRSRYVDFACCVGCWGTHSTGFGASVDRG